MRPLGPLGPAKKNQNQSHRSEARVQGCRLSWSIWGVVRSHSLWSLLCASISGLAWLAWWVLLACCRSSGPCRTATGCGPRDFIAWVIPTPTTLSTTTCPRLPRLPRLPPGARRAATSRSTSSTRSCASFRSAASSASLASPFHLSGRSKTALPLVPQVPKC